MTEIKKKLNLTTSIEVPIVDEAVIENSLKDRKLDKLGRAYATGRRKRSIARLWLSSGNEFMVGEKKLEEYFPQFSLQEIIKAPLKLVNMNSVKVFCTLSGGGTVSQAKAIQLAISRALSIFQPELRVILRSNGFLTRDSRKKEREHAGFSTTRGTQQYNRR